MPLPILSISSKWVFLSANMYAAVQEQVCMLVTRSWICSRIVPANHLAPVSAKACHKLQSRTCITVIYPVHELTWAQEQRRKGQPVEITGWMRPSGDVTVPGATLLSEVKKNKALCCQTGTGSFRQIHPGGLDHTPLCFTLSGTALWWTCWSNCLFHPLPCYFFFFPLGGECFRNDFRQQTKQYDLQSSWKV